MLGTLKLSAKLKIWASLVGVLGVEPRTPSLSVTCSYQLSYTPKCRIPNIPHRLHKINITNPNTKTPRVAGFLLMLLTVHTALPRRSPRGRRRESRLGIETKT